MALFGSGTEYSEHEKKHILIKVNIKDKNRREQLYELLNNLVNGENSEEAKSEFIEVINGPSFRDTELEIKFPKFKGFDERWYTAPAGILDHVVDVKKERTSVFFCIEMQDLVYSSSDIENMLYLFMFSLSNKLWARLRGNDLAKERLYEEFDYGELADVIKERKSDREWIKI